MKRWLFMIAAATTFASCEREKQECPRSTERMIALSGFNKINAAETFSISVEQGSTYGIKVRGCANDLNDIIVSVQPGGLLDIRYNRFNKQRYRVEFEVIMPELLNCTFAGASKGSIRGSDLQHTPLVTTLGGTATCEINAAPLNVQFALSGTGELTVWGVVDRLSGTVSGAARLSAYTTTAQEIDVQTEGTAKAFVVPAKRLKATAAGASRIYYKGNPSASLEVHESGTAKVVRES